MSTAWDAAKLEVASDRPLVRRYRRHQSWYREAVLGARFGHHGSGTKRRPVGSLLATEEVERDRALNFLGDPEVLRYVDERVPAVVRCGGTLEEGRLRHNMLSSMPMAFSLVAALRAAPDRAAIVSRLFDLEVSDVLVAAPSSAPGCECRTRATHAEWAPDPALHLHDRTAFDAAIWYLDERGDLGVIGIETKYTETLSPTEYDSERYRQITRSCGWFTNDAPDVLRGRDTNQLWRNALLAASLEHSPDPSGQADRAAVGIIGLDCDEALWASCDQLRSQMRVPDHVVPRSWERTIGVLAGTSLASFAALFSERYLELDPAPSGPCRPRRSTTATERLRWRRFNAVEHGQLRAQATAGDDPDWDVWLPSVWRALHDPAGIASIPLHPPPFEPVEAGAWWQPLLHLGHYSFGWPQPAVALDAWDRLGRPLDDPRFSLIEAIWGRHLDALLHHLWFNRPELDQVVAKALGLGPPPDLPEPPTNLSRHATGASFSTPNPATGGSDPLHLTDHCSVPVEQDPDATRLTIGTASTGGSPHATFSAGRYAGWYRALHHRAADLPPPPGRNGWRVDVVVQPIGYLGTYRRSTLSGRWFAGQHRWHTLGLT